MFSRSGLWEGKEWVGWESSFPPSQLSSGCFATIGKVCSSGLAVCPLSQALRSVSAAHEEGKGLVAWIWGRGSTARLQQKANLPFHSSCALPPLTEPCREISNQTVNPPSTESSKTPIPSPRGHVY